MASRKTYGIAFTDCGEIRMGSPYNLCRIRLSGPWVPDLPETDWQDLAAVREDGRAVALVRWDTPGNLPGFRILVLDADARSLETSPRFPGCCRTLRWTGTDTLAWEAFPDREGTFEREPR